MVTLRLRRRNLKLTRADYQRFFLRLRYSKKIVAYLMCGHFVQPLLSRESRGHRLVSTEILRLAPRMTRLVRRDMYSPLITMRSDEQLLLPLMNLLRYWSTAGPMVVAASSICTAQLHPTTRSRTMCSFMN